MTLIAETKDAIEVTEQIGSTIRIVSAVSSLVPALVSYGWSKNLLAHWNGIDWRAVYSLGGILACATGAVLLFWCAIAMQRRRIRFDFSTNEVIQQITSPLASDTEHRYPFSHFARLVTRTDNSGDSGPYYLLKLIATNGAQVALPAIGSKVDAERIERVINERVLIS